MQITVTCMIRAALCACPIFTFTPSFVQVRTVYNTMPSLLFKVVAIRAQKKTITYLLFCMGVKLDRIKGITQTGDV
jgi:hypothetical protein